MASASTYTMESPLSGTPAVFMKTDDLVGQARDFTICKAIADKIGAEQLIGCQRIGKLWRIYLKTQESRIKLITNSVQISGQTVPIYAENPYRTGAHDPDQKITKITIKDMPLSKGNTSLQKYLEGKAIKLTRGMEYAKTRDPETHQLSDWLNGDRICYAENFQTPLPRTAFIGDTKVRFFHEGQEQPTEKLCTRCYATDHFRSRCPNPASCIRCRKASHGPGERCEASLEVAQDDVRPIQGKEDVLSNFYPCKISVFGIEAKSAEHAYQYSKAIQKGEIDAAKKILEARNASDAKYQSRFLKQSASWKAQRDDIMKQVLAAKAEQVPEFKTELIHSGEQKLVETVRNEMYWASGLDTQDTLHTKQEFWLGKNQLGCLLTELRSKLQSEQNQVKKKKKPRSKKDKVTRRDTRSTSQHKDRNARTGRLDAATCNDDDQGQDYSSDSDGSVSTG